MTMTKVAVKTKYDMIYTFIYMNGRLLAVINTTNHTGMFLLAFFFLLIFLNRGTFVKSSQVPTLHTNTK